MLAFSNNAMQTVYKTYCWCRANHFPYMYKACTCMCIARTLYMHCIYAPCQNRRQYNILGAALYNNISLSDLLYVIIYTVFKVLFIEHDIRNYDVSRVQYNAALSRPQLTSHYYIILYYNTMHNLNWQVHMSLSFPCLHDIVQNECRVIWNSGKGKLRSLITARLASWRRHTWWWLCVPFPFCLFPFQVRWEANNYSAVVKEHNFSNFT